MANNNGSNRMDDNLKILAAIEKAIKADSELRISQILYNLKIVVDNVEGQPGWKDEFYTEPHIVLDRLKK